MGRIALHIATARRIALAGVMLLAAGCVATYRDHGYVPKPEDLAAIKVGVDTRDSVREAIGTPGSTGVLNLGGYYYVSSRVRHYGAKKPEIVARELVAISFDSRGRVANIERFGLERGQVIPLERRITDNGESDRTFLRQLLGNLGRIGPGAFKE